MRDAFEAGFAIYEEAIIALNLHPNRRPPRTRWAPAMKAFV